MLTTIMTYVTYETATFILACCLGLWFLSYVPYAYENFIQLRLENKIRRAEMRVKLERIESKNETEQDRDNKRNREERIEALSTEKSPPKPKKKKKSKASYKPSTS